jgi:dephospho-CoA kinase
MRLRVGLTGGIGSGKTTAGRMLADLGALVIDADELAREAVAAGSPGFERVVARWPGVRAPDGTLDRAALAAIVFADPGERVALNAILHPVVRALAATREAAAGEDQIVVHEVPLLFETGFDRLCDATVLVTAERAHRILRAAARSGLTVAEVERRMDAQIEPAEARDRATVTVDNDGTLGDLRASIADVWGLLLAIPAEPFRNRPALTE